MICNEIETVHQRPLTEEEIAEMLQDLIMDFSDEAYMQSIIDNSYFNVIIIS